MTRTNNEGTHRLILGAIGATLESRFGADRPLRPRGRPAVWAPWEAALRAADEAAAAATPSRPRDPTVMGTL